jgi:hypothetical protein
MRALEKEPGSRQQSAEELDQECQGCMAELFPRQTPGSGMHNVVAPAAPPVSHAPPPAAAAPPPAAPPNPAYAATAAGPAPVVGQAPVAEMKTMMAGMPAPVVPKGAPQEQKTMMAGMQAPNLGSMAPPPAAGPPPSAFGPPPPAPPPPSASPVAEQKTMMAGMPAPVVPQGSNMKTMAVAAPAPGQAGTQIIPDSQGVVAYARDRAAAARESAGPDTIPAQPAGALFWLAWIIIGIGAGLGIHFWLAHRAAQGGLGGG